MAETWITRRQWIFLVSELGNRAKTVLEEAKIFMETDLTVGDDELSYGTIYGMAASVGCYIAADVARRDIARKMPWLTPKQCDEIACSAADILDDSGLHDDICSDCINAAVSEYGGHVWENFDQPFTDSEGRIWTSERDQDGCRTIVCSDGRVFKEDGSEWTKAGGSADV